MKTTGHKIRHWMLQTLRRTIQVTVILLVAFLSYLSLYAHYRSANALDDETQLTGVRGFVLRQLHQRIDSMDDPQTFIDDNKGTVWSMRIAGFDLTDPLAAIEATAATRKIHWPLLLSIAAPVLITLILGKVFCSWICPANLLLEVTGKLRKLLRFAELPPAKVKFSRTNKYVLLGVGTVIAACVAAPIFALIYPPAVLSRLVHAWIFGTAMAGMLIVIGLIVVTELLISPRWWCRTMCPGGALYGLIGWPRLLRVGLDADRCTKCAKCQPACEPGLDPVRESYGLECDNCGECVRVCPDVALRFTVGLPMVGSKKTVDKTPSAVKVAALLVPVMLLLTPSAARGHHILGLPHYSYKENYPQAPVLEYPATTGPYKVLLVCYPGKPIPGEPANLVFDIKHGDSGQRYDQPIGVRVLQTFTFGNNREVLPATQVQAFDVLHKLSANFPEDGEYVVELTMDVEGQTEVIPFLVIAGNPTATKSILIAVGVGLAVFLVVVRAVKIKRDRRKKEGVE